MATAKKSSAKKSTTKKAPAKKSPSKSSAKKSASKSSTKTASKSTKKSSAKKSSGGGQACWPGFEHTPGTTPGAKGSCKPKKHQTAGEKKADSKAAAASKREKGKG